MSTRNIFFQQEIRIFLDSLLRAIVVLPCQRATHKSGLEWLYQTMAIVVTETSLIAPVKESFVIKN